MKRLAALWFVGSLAGALLIATVATAGPRRTAGELRVHAILDMSWKFGDFCPPGTPGDLECVRFLGTGSVPGLGRATVTYVKTVEFANPVCPVIQFRTAVIAVAGKGEIRLSVPREICGQTAPATTGPFDVVVTGGSGVYANASGTLQFSSSVFRGETARDTWTGTIVVPGLVFDTTAPALTGAVSKTVRLPAGATRVRVRYAVTAQDEVDGIRAVTCTPRSGSLFAAGRTTITCSATDSSGNTRRARFAITVR